MSESIIQVFFHMTSNIKLYHWNTMQYSRHKASDELHSALSSLIDTFVETYIGEYKRPQFSFNIKVKLINDNSICELLREYIQFLKFELPKQLDKSDTHLLNIRDELLTELNKTLYLFTLT